MFWCRYKIAGDVGDGHKVLGKLMNCSMLSTRELDKLVSDVAMMDTSRCAVYGRVLLSGVLYTSAMYHRSEITNDSIVRLKTGDIGTIEKFVSFCEKDCTACNESTFCKHHIIVSIHPSFPYDFIDQTADCTARHVVRIGNPG